LSMRQSDVLLVSAVRTAWFACLTCAGKAQAGLEEAGRGREWWARRPFLSTPAMTPSGMCSGASQPRSPCRRAETSVKIVVLGKRQRVKERGMFFFLDRE
jgi:hypothetical protein